MIPTEQGRHFIEQAERVLREVDRLDRSVQEEQERCAELRVMIPHATYASYAAVDYLEQAASIERLHIHIREGGSMEALDHVWIMSCGRGIIWLCCGTPWRMTSTIPITAPGGA